MSDQDLAEAPDGIDGAVTGARVLFLVRVPHARQDDFLAAYNLVRYAVARGVPGHLRDQVCQSDTDPEQWLITSEWDRLQSFVDWERSPEHRELVRPLRKCMTEARSSRFQVLAETRRTRDAGAMS